MHDKKNYFKQDISNAYNSPADSFRQCFVGDVSYLMADNFLQIFLESKLPIEQLP